MHVKSLDVQTRFTFYSTENEEKSCFVEKWNRIMNGKRYKFSQLYQLEDNVDVSDAVVIRHNNTKHSTIKLTPEMASEKKNENIVWMKLCSKEITHKY
jgi:hypothetical protein